MRETLTRLMYDRYPTLFAEHRLSTDASGMAWGFQHDDGWFAIVDVLAALITAHAPRATATVVKQKMGILRITLTDGDHFTDGACSAAGRFSLTISELTGRQGALMVGRQGRWLKTLAPGEKAGFVPRAFPMASSIGEGATDNRLDLPEALEASAGKAAFHQAMAPRLDPVTGACGPVDDHGKMAPASAGK